MKIKYLFIHWGKLYKKYWIRCTGILVLSITNVILVNKVMGTLGSPLTNSIIHYFLVGVLCFLFFCLFIACEALLIVTCWPIYEYFKNKFPSYLDSLEDKYKPDENIARKKKFLKKWKRL